MNAWTVNGRTCHRAADVTSLYFHLVGGGQWIYNSERDQNHNYKYNPTRSSSSERRCVVEGQVFFYWQLRAVLVVPSSEEQAAVLMAKVAACREEAKATLDAVDRAHVQQAAADALQKAAEDEEARRQWIAGEGDRRKRAAALAAKAAEDREAAARQAAQAFEADSAALPDSSPYPAIDAAMLNMMTNNVSNPLRVVPPGFLEASIKLLQKVLANILAEPAEQKFRSLKKTNKQVAAKILTCRGALQLLTACGFRSADGVLTLADDSVDVPKLEYAQSRLGGVGAEKAAAEEGAAKAAEEARVALYKQHQEDRRVDREA
eukprot:COSAG06_NODE_17152_length_958_cov_1.440047_1_plen_318_part_11